MALMPCPECGWNVSTKATACPQCGYPIGADPTTHPAPDPGNLQKWEEAVGTELLFEVTGRTKGPVYGTDVYTSDSDLASAAVHAGVLRPQETAIVKVCIVPVLPTYRGTTRHGVVSRDWASPWQGAYRVERWTARPEGE
jgi:hypothetical protein